MAGFTDDASRWIYFVFIVILMNFSMAAFFKFIAFRAENADIAQLTAGPAVAVRSSCSPPFHSFICVSSSSSCLAASFSQQINYQTFSSGSTICRLSTGVFAL